MLGLIEPQTNKDVYTYIERDVYVYKDRVLLDIYTSWQSSWTRLSRVCGLGFRVECLGLGVRVYILVLSREQ